MTAQEKAKAGLWLIEEAVLQLIKERGRPMQPVEVGEALGLRWQDADGGGFSGIGYNIMMEMSAAGKLVKGEGVRPTYSLPR
jgi:hypothetical protein